MQVNAALNLVFPIRTDSDGNPIVYAYHTPISREVFEANYRVIADTQVLISGKGRIGISIATLALKDAAAQYAREQGLDFQSVPLLADVRRLTQVLAPGSNGYAPMPVDVALQTQVIDADEWAEAESAIVFFSCAFSLVPKNAREGLANALASVMKGSITSSTPSAFSSSLQLATTNVTSNETAVEPAAPTVTRSDVPQ